MTSIRGHIEATRRPGELGVHSMDSFNLMVPDLKIAQKFYSSFGLDVREEGNALGLYTTGSTHRWATISEGQRKHLKHLTFGVFEASLIGSSHRSKSMDKSSSIPRGNRTQTGSGFTTTTDC